MLVAADFTLVLNDLVAHSREQIGPAVVVVLCPAIRGMIVTLGALQACAEEDLRGGLGPRAGVAVWPVKVRRGTVVRAAVCGHEFADELVDGLVFRNAPPNPVMKILHTFLVERMSFDAQQVRPLQRPEIRELGPVKQLIDQARPFITSLV